MRVAIPSPSRPRVHAGDVLTVLVDGGERQLEVLEVSGANATTWLMVEVPGPGPVRVGEVLRVERRS